MFDEVEDIEGKRSISCTNLVYVEVFIWKVFQQVLRYEAASDCSCVPGLSIFRINECMLNREETTHSEELGGGMPELGVMAIFSITLSDFRSELG